MSAIEDLDLREGARRRAQWRTVTVDLRLPVSTVLMTVTVVPAPGRRAALRRWLRAVPSSIRSLDLRPVRIYGPAAKLPPLLKDLAYSRDVGVFPKRRAT